MRGSSKIIMGATMAMLIILAFVLGLVLVLLAELYCSLLLGRRKLKDSKSDSLPETLSISAPQLTGDQLVPSPLGSFYAQGVLDAPRSFLFPKLPSQRETRAVVDDVEKVKLGKLHEFLRVQSPRQLGLASSSPSPSYISVLQPQQQQQTPQETEIETELGDDIEACYGVKRENLMYISNPIYDNEAAYGISRVDTPFETPDSSPSRMEQSGSGSGSSGDEKEVAGNQFKSTTSPTSFPLTPIKDIPAKASSVVPRDSRSLGNSVSESNTHSHIDCSSSSSSGTPCTSPSW